MTPKYGSESSSRPTPSPVEGEGTEFDRLFTLYYDELREIARRHLRRERVGHTLQTTALMHEAYLKLGDRPEIEWQEPVRFRAFVSKAMRHVLIDHARGRATHKRGGGAIQITLQAEMAGADEASSIELLDLDRALTQLGDYDPRLVRVVECRFFGGLTAAEIAETLDISASTVERDWARAKAYLQRLLSPPPADP
jgi:RNA polymerase sigma factor (TIGR02999 family)